MMRRPPQPNSIEDEARQEAEDEMEASIAEIALELGPAPGAMPLSDARKVKLWGQKDPSVDFEAMRQALMSTGLNPSLMDPHGDESLAVFQEMADRPDFQQFQAMYAEPLDEQLATTLTTIAEYPFRLSLLADLEDDPKAMVAEANRINDKWQASLGLPDADPSQIVTPTRQPEAVSALDATMPPMGGPAPQPMPAAMPVAMGG